MITQVKSGATMGQSSGWQVVLADLALILFLVTLAALAAGAHEGKSSPVATPEIAASQALFRPAEDGPTLAAWLDQRQPDPRATLTVVARHADGDEAAVWITAQAMANAARGRGFPVRVVISQGQESDIYASLAYDDVK